MIKRQYSLDFLKVIATVLILFHHYQQFISGSFDTGINFYGGKYNFGCMVELFFILSGYFMYPYIEKIEQGMLLKDFFIPRYVRLIPMVAVSAFAYQFLVLVHIKTVGIAWFMDSFSLWETIVAALGFQEGWIFRGNTYVNYPVWYISVLLICYLVFYVTTRLSKMLHVSGRYFYMAMIFVGIAINSYGVQLPFLNEYTSRGYYAFFTGVLLASYCFDRNSSKRECIISLITVMAFCGLVIFCNGLLAEGVYYLSAFALFPAVIMLFKSSIVCKLCDHSIFQTAAAIAFNSYIWQMPLLVLLLIFINKVPVEVSFISRGCMLGFLVVAIVVGIVSFLLIEKKLASFFVHLKKTSEV